VFRTSDGGDWEKFSIKMTRRARLILRRSAQSECVFSALYQVQRTPWGMDSGGPGSGLYARLTAVRRGSGSMARGFRGNHGRIGVSVSGADSNRVYALIEAKESGLFGRRMGESRGRASTTISA